LRPPQQTLPIKKRRLFENPARCHYNNHTTIKQFHQELPTDDDTSASSDSDDDSTSFCNVARKKILTRQRHEDNEEDSEEDEEGSDGEEEDSDEDEKDNAASLEEYRIPSRRLDRVLEKVDLQEFRNALYQLRSARFVIYMAEARILQSFGNKIL